MPAGGTQPGHRKFSAIIIGTGGHGADWCRRILPPFVAAQRIEIVAAVDVAADALVNARRYLGLSPDRCYTDLDIALIENPADFCIVVTPPATHEAVVHRAIKRGFNVLCEKPLADTLEACIRMAAEAAQADVKLGVTMNHRFDQDKTTLRQQLAATRYGPLDYLIYRFTCDFRKFPSYGRTQHQMAHPLLLDAAVHHLDIIMDMVGAPCETVYAQTWNPAWGEFRGDSQSLILMTFTNGCRAMYEGALANAFPINSWADDYIRVECRDATLVLDHRKLRVFPHRRDLSAANGTIGAGVEIPLLERPSWLHAWLIDQFMDWLDGGPEMATSADRNLSSIATVFAAIASSESGLPVRAADLLSDARKAVADTEGKSVQIGDEF